MADGFGGVTMIKIMVIEDHTQQLIMLVYTTMSPFTDKPGVKLSTR